MAFIEIFSKSIFYYLHERFWFKSSVRNSKKRHIYKTVSWRLIATIDSLVICLLITGNPFLGIKIGLWETINKSFLYFLHEKIWYKFKTS